MGSASHSQGIPQRPGQASRRDSRAIRERDREKTADIREAVHIRPLGPRHALVRNRRDGTAYRVENPTGRTFSRDAIVKLGSNTGHPKEFIIGGAPAKAGRAAAPPSRVTRIAPYVASVGTARYFAFFVEGGLVAAIYSSAGEWMEDRGTLGSAGTETPDGGNAICIATDSAELVGAGALAWRSDVDELTVWDVAGEAEYSYTTTQGDTLSPPVYHDGWLYWLEAPTENTVNFHVDLWLMQGRCDLTSVSVLEAFDLTTANAEIVEIGSHRIAVTESHVLGSVTAQDGALEVDYALLVTCDFEGGSAASHVGGGSDRLGLVIGLAAAAGDAVGLGTGGVTLRAMADDITDCDAVTRWPNADEWELDSATNASATQDGATATVYGTDPEASRVLVEAPPSAVAGTPAAVVAITDHPDLEEAPALLFLMT